MTMTLEQLKALNLSEEQMKALAPVVEENSQAEIDRSKRRDEERAERVTKRIGELKEMGFSEDNGFAGFLRVVEERLLADDGEPALVLSEKGRPKGETFTEALDVILSTFPVDKEGKLAVELSQQHFEGSEGKKPPEGGDETKTASEKADEFRRKAGIQTHLIGKP